MAGVLVADRLTRLYAAITRLSEQRAMDESYRLHEPPAHRRIDHDAALHVRVRACACTGRRVKQS